MSYDLKSLEFDKILSRLKQYAMSQQAKKQIDGLLPSGDFDVVSSLLTETNEAFGAMVQLSALPFVTVDQPFFSIERAAIGATLNEEELLSIVSLLDSVVGVHQYFRMLEQLPYAFPSLKQYVENLLFLPKLKKAITEAIVSDMTVSDHASKELYTIRRSIALTENRLKNKLNDLLAHRFSQLTEPLIVLRNNRFCLPVKAEYKNSFKGIVQDVSSSNTTYYIEPSETIETANQIETLKIAEKKEIDVILKKLTLLVREQSDILRQNTENLIALDVIYAKAKMAYESQYQLPNLTKEFYFDLKKACHPLIPMSQVVPIDVALGKDYRTMIITGPNTGGKTVLLKTVGLLHAMVACGMMIPADASSVVGVYESILVDIGDEQSIEQSLSTFSAHLQKMKEIMDRISFSSLVLLDELGSGTDPKEGSCLAIAMIDFIKRRGAKMLVTTHYSDLKNYAYQEKDILNASVEFDSQTLMPTYRLLLGIPGKSNAIEIASRLGMKQEIIDDARLRLKNDASFNQQVMENLEKEMALVLAKETELAHKIEWYDGKIKEITAEKKAITEARDRILKQTEQQALVLVEKAKEEAFVLLEQLKSMKENDYKEHELASVKHHLKTMHQVAPEEAVFKDEIHENDYVYIRPYEQYGTVLRIKKDIYTVRMGQLTMDFHHQDLQKATPPKPKAQPKREILGTSSHSSVPLSLDLRGKRYEEVAYLLEQYLDKAVLMHYEQVSIIHGFGTGAIRKAVWAHLKTSGYVKSYRFGQEGEGLNGVTVVTLK